MDRKNKSLKHYVHRLQPFWDVRSEYGIIGTKKRPYGIDLSRYEPRFHADQVEAGLIDFAIIKATQNDKWVDPAFGQLYVDIQPLAVTGAFHYLSSGISGVAQAEHFLRTIGSRRLNVLAVDFESYGNTVNDAFVRVLYDWLVYVSQQRPNQRVILYTNPNLYDTVIHPAALRIWGRDVFADWDLWIAQYYWVVNPDGEPNIKKRTDWKLWQISDAGDPVMHGTEGWCDRNVFNGTLSQLLEWAGSGSIPEPPPNNGGSMEVDVISSTHNLSMRPLHQVGSTSFLTIPLGTAVKGDDLWIAPETVVGVVQKNDVWAHVTYGGKMGWVGLVHLGKVYGTYKVISAPADGVADMPYRIVLGGGDSPYQETVLTGTVKAK